MAKQEAEDQIGRRNLQAEPAQFPEAAQGTWNCQDPTIISQVFSHWAKQVYNK